MHHHDDLQISLRPDRERIFACLSGEIDLASIPLVESTLDELLSRGWRDIVLDLRETTFIDSTGVALLLGARRRSHAEGWRFGIVPPEDGPVARVLALSRADELLRVVDAITAPS